MKNFMNFNNIFGFESEIDEMTNVDETPVETDGADDLNTQELQEEIPAIINTDNVDNVVDDLGETFEEGYTDRPKSDIDYIPEELKAEIDAIEATADQHAQVGADVGLTEDDSYNEVPGGVNVDLRQEEETTMKGVDEVAEYAEIDEVKVTGISGDLDQQMREEYDEDRYQEDPENITGPAADAVEISADNMTINDYGNEPEEASDADTDHSEMTVGIDQLDGDEDENQALPGVSEVVGTESDDGEFDYTEDDEEEGEDEGDEDLSEDTTDDGEDETESSSDDEEPVEEVEEETEEEEEVSEDVENDEEEVEMPETTVGEDGEETMTGEENEIVASLDVDLNFDEGHDLDSEEDNQTAEQAASETEIEIPNTALDEVSEMVTVNDVDGETPEPQTTEVEGDYIETATIDDETMMSDVIGEKAAETSHGDEDGEGFWEGDIPVNGDVDPENPEQQLSEGDASYDEEGAGSDDSDVEDMEDAEDAVEADAVEDSIDGDGSAVDTPEEADAEIEEATEEVDEEETETEVEEEEE